MIKNKKAQFFILAAVIISAVIASLSVTYNSVNINQEPQKFYDLSQELKQESAKVIDYGVYTNTDPTSLIGDFTVKVAENLRDQYPDLGFVFIYGNAETVIIENYGKEKSLFEVGDTEGSVEGAGEEIQSNINLDIEGSSFNVSATQTADSFGYAWRASIIDPEQANIIVKVNDQEYDFRVRDNEQFFIVLIKSEGREEFVDIK